MFYHFEGIFSSEIITAEDGDVFQLGTCKICVRGNVYLKCAFLCIYWGLHKACLWNCMRLFLLMIYSYNVAVCVELCTFMTAGPSSVGRVHDAHGLHHSDV